jgi:hypothetical protein
MIDYRHQWRHWCPRWSKTCHLSKSGDDEKSGWCHFSWYHAISAGRTDLGGYLGLVSPFLTTLSFNRHFWLGKLRGVLSELWFYSMS